MYVHNFIIDALTFDTSTSKLRFYFTNYQFLIKRFNCISLKLHFAVMPPVDDAPATLFFYLLPEHGNLFLTLVPCRCCSLCLDGLPLSLTAHDQHVPFGLPTISTFPEKSSPNSPLALPRRSSPRESTATFSRKLSTTFSPKTEECSVTFLY